MIQGHDGNKTTGRSFVLSRCLWPLLNILLVGFSLVQPNATYEGPHHASNDNGQTNSPSIHLFTLRGKANIDISGYRLYKTSVTFFILQLSCPGNSGKTTEVPGSSYLCQGHHHPLARFLYLFQTWVI
ncbi:hypothetical protein PAMP_005541 [Pampus punctatissimus]